MDDVRQQDPLEQDLRSIGQGREVRQVLEGIRTLCHEGSLRNESGTTWGRWLAATTDRKVFRGISEVLEGCMILWGIGSTGTQPASLLLRRFSDRRLTGAW